MKKKIKKQALKDTFCFVTHLECIFKCILVLFYKIYLSIFIFKTRILKNY